MTPTNTNSHTGTETMTVNDALAAMLALYATPGTWTRDGDLNLEAALYRVIGDPEADGITETEWRRRTALVGGVSDACGVDLGAFNDAALRQDVVVSVLRAGLG